MGISETEWAHASNTTKKCGWVGATLVGGGEIEVIVDSGSEISIISEKLARMAGTPIATTQKYHLTGATNTEIPSAGTTTVTLDFGPVRLQQKCVVAPDFRHDLILGEDFLTQFGVIVNYNDGVLQIGDKVIPFVAKNPIRLKNTGKVLRIEAKSHRRVIAEIDGSFQPGQDVYIPGGFLSGKPELFIPRSVGRITDQGKICLEISNTSLKPLDLEPDVALASGQEVVKPPENATIRRADEEAGETELDEGGMDHLNETDKAEIKRIITDSRIKINMLGRVRGMTTSIDTDDASPINVRQYRLPMAKRLEARAETEKMLMTGVIRESTSPWNSPVVLVTKSGGGTRFAIDFRKLNAVTRRQVYPMPRIEDCLNSLGSGTHFTLLDLQSAYWQVALDEDAKPKTAFSVEGMGHFEFNVMPYGLTNAAAVFQRMIDQVLVGLHWTHLLCYIDDVIVFGSSMEEHNERLAIVLQKLADANLGLNLGKCAFAKTQVRYLGHLIGGGEIKADPDKVAAVERFPQPTNATQVRSFLGLASYYRRFVKDFASVTKPLTDLTKTKGAPRFEWNRQAEEAFQAIKTALINAPCLTCLDQTAPLVLQVDASQVGLGAVLCSEVNGEERPIAFASRQLKPSEQKYSAIQKEALALLWGLQHFHYWVFGTQVTLITDHCPLSYLRSMAPKSQLLSRWLLILQCYTFTIRHRPGKANANADALSRCPIEGTGEPMGKELCPTFIEVNAVDLRPDDIAMAQDNDPELDRIKLAVKNTGTVKGTANRGASLNWKAASSSTDGDPRAHANPRGGCESNWWSL